MSPRKNAARKRLLESLGASESDRAQMTDKELAAASYRAILDSVASQSDLVDNETAAREVTSEVKKMRDEKRGRSRIGVNR